jgi:hypothetical protein
LRCHLSGARSISLPHLKYLDYMPVPPAVACESQRLAEIHEMTLLVRSYGSAQTLASIAITTHLRSRTSGRVVPIFDAALQLIEERVPRQDYHSDEEEQVEALPSALGYSGHRSESEGCKAVEHNLVIGCFWEFGLDSISALSRALEYLQRVTCLFCWWAS